jgi:hypothetical protein
MKMKLFYWPHVRTLADWADGQVFAIAADVGEAIDEACRDYGVRSEMLRAELESTDPEVHSEPFAVCVTGSA